MPDVRWDRICTAWVPQTSGEPDNLRHPVSPNAVSCCDVPGTAFAWHGHQGIREEPRNLPQPRFSKCRPFPRHPGRIRQGCSFCGPKAHGFPWSILWCARMTLGSAFSQHGSRRIWGDTGISGNPVSPNVVHCRDILDASVHDEAAFGPGLQAPKLNYSPVPQGPWDGICTARALNTSGGPGDSSASQFHQMPSVV